MKVQRDSDTSADGETPDGASDTTDQEATAPTASAFGDENGVVEGRFDKGNQPTAAGPLGSMLDEAGEVSGSFDGTQTAGGPTDDTEADAETDDSADAQGTADASAEDDTPTDDADAEGATDEATEDADDRQARREEWLGRVQEETGIQAESTDELAEEVNRLKSQNAGFHELQQLVQDNPGFQQMLSHMADGKTVAEAAAALDGVTSEAPDPNENPEAYAEWKAAQKMKEQQTQQERQQQSERQQQIEREQRRMQEEFQNVVGNNDLSDDQAQQLGETLARLTVTKPDARLRAKDLETLRKGMQYDQALEQARNDAYQKGREEALQEVRGDGTVQAEDTPPTLYGAGGASENSEGSSQTDSELGKMFGPGTSDTTDLHGRV